MMGSKSEAPGAATLGAQVNGDAGGVCVRFDSSTDAGPAQPPAHGRIVADVWYKTARGSVHMLRNPRGWAVDYTDLAAAEACGAVFLRIVDAETGRQFWAALSNLRTCGFPVRRGFGVQLALALADWAPTREALGEPEPARQLSFVGLLR